MPHVILASFSLHYLRGDDERAAFFAHLRRTCTRPTLLLIIKGVGTRERPPDTLVGIESVFFGVHYVIGADRNPRVVEMHLCLVTPPPHEDDAPTTQQQSAQPPGEGGAGATTSNGVQLARPPRWSAQPQLLLCWWLPRRQRLGWWRRLWW